MDTFSGDDLNILCIGCQSNLCSCVLSSKEPNQQRVKRWAFGIDEVLKDPVGREQFLKFLESEFSSENLRCDEAHLFPLKANLSSNAIFAEVRLLNPGACSVNICVRM